MIQVTKFHTQWLQLAKLTIKKQDSDAEKLQVND